MRSYIHLIRHGLTQGIMEEWFYGSLDIPVTPEGCAILEDLKRQGIYPKLENADYYTSGMLRAEQTLNIIYDNPRRTKIPDLRELNFGDWEGMHFKDLESMTDWVAWSHDITGEYSFPNGDSAKSFSTRVYKGWDEVMKRHEKKVEEMAIEKKEAHSVVVCHGGTIAVLMATFFREETGDDFFQWSPETGRGYTLIMEGGEIVGHEAI